MRPEILPFFVQIGASQVEDRLSALGCPTHPSAFETVLDQMAASAFDNPGSDGIACGNIRIIAHVRPVVVKVDDDISEDFLPAAPQPMLGPHLLEAPDDIADFAFQEHAQLGCDGVLRLWGAFLVELVGGLPQILHAVPQVQNADGFGQVFLLQLPQPGSPSPRKITGLGSWICR